MKQLVNTTKKKIDEQQKKAVLRLEMDYELATLFEAIGQSNQSKMKECKQKLERIRHELFKLKAL